MELDMDLKARQEARCLAKQAGAAAEILKTFPQEKLDAIVKSVAESFGEAAKELAQLAAQETGFGNARDKTVKNEFASRQVWEAIKNMKTVGILGGDPQEKLVEIGVPVGAIGAIVPSTNPTSTVCYKALIALKAGCSIVFSPHPKALECTTRAAKIIALAAQSAGAPQGAVSCLTVPSLEGCRELMSAKEIRLILATGGPAMVRAAYSSGKPAIGVGAGNGPAYIHPSADIDHALECIVKSKSFDYGTICASEQSIIVEKSIEQEVRKAAAAKGCYFMDTQQAQQLAKLLFKPNGALTPAIVGKPAVQLAQMAGFSVPDTVKVLLAREEEAGPTRPYSMDKLCPVLAFYVMEDEDAVLKKAQEVLSHEGSGHTFAMHATDPKAVEKFALQIPVSRFLVNTPAALGGIGATTKLFPALTLGCGAVGGSSSSNNISPMDLVNIRRVAWDTEKTPENTVTVDESLVELVTRKILEKLG